MITGAFPASPKCKSGRFNVPRVMKKFPATVMTFGVVTSEGYIMPSHIFEVSLKVNTKVYLDVLTSVLIPWGNQVAGGRLCAGPQDQGDQGLASEGVQRLCTFLSLAPLLSLPEPAGQLCLVIHQEHHQHDLPQHQNHPPSIRRAPAGACGKGLLQVPDLYRGGD